MQRELGAGGMGVVYEALDTEKNAVVALKTLRRVSPHSLYRLKKEFRALQNLEHPNLVSLGELYEEDGTWFFTMELVEGKDLRSYLRAEQDVRRVASATADTLDGSSSEGLLLFDENRLRHSLRQLSSALCALHDAGKVHRDIKPSNILVTPEGRLVLLDFGLALDTDAEDPSTEADVVGTVAYMAPEQAASKRVGPAADWYSVGVLMYEAMSGRLPFRGNIVQVTMDKQTEQPPSISGSVSGLPTDLASLCMELLRFEPDSRPRGIDLLKRLGVGTEATPSRPRPSHSLPFFGRDKELEQLRHAAEEARAGNASAVVVVGESGLGKSALIRKFTEEAASDANATVVLTGRCYELESVPYKALDGVIDALSHYMRRIGDQEAAQLAPRQVALLPRVFPVLGRVPVIAQAPAPKHEIPDPHELRRRIVAVLRELFHSMTDRHPLILVIDDLQWADVDSLSLLAELMRPPEAPPLLLLASARTQLAQEISESTTLIELGPLDPEQAVRFAEQLLKKTPSALPVRAAEIAKEAEGHPLFIDELVRHAAVATRTDQRLRLDEVIWARVSALPGSAREILQLACIADVPLPEKVIRLAAGVDPAAFARGLSLLRTDHLVRGVGVDNRRALKPYHNRIRKAVVANLDKDQTKKCHSRLSTAIEGSPVAHDRPEQLLRHLEAAGQLEKAESYARRAARRAAEQLAFDRSAELFRAALRLCTYEPEYQFLVEVGDALSNAGCSAEAADLYRRASKRTSIPAEALDMKRLAAEKLLQSGHIEEGLLAIEHVLSSMGMRLPSTPRSALLSLLYRRALLRLRGLRFKKRAESELPAELLRRIDACWSVASGLSMVDPVRGADFQTRALLYALSAGEPTRVARGLAAEAGFLSTGGGEARRAKKILERAKDLSVAAGDWRGQGLAWLAAATIGNCTSDWRGGIDAGEKALAIFHEHCSGVSWEIDTAQIFRLTALACVGRLAELREGLPHILRDAEARGDRLLTNMIEAGLAPRACLAAGDSRAARAHVTSARRAWTQQGAHVQHLIQDLIECEIDLYEGRLTEADAILSAIGKEGQNLLPYLQALRVLARSYRAAIAMGQAVAGVLTAPARLQREIRRLRGEGLQWSHAFANLFAAQQYVLGDRRAKAFPLFSKSELEFEEAGMHVHMLMARRLHGLSRGGAEGAQLVASADEEMRKCGVDDPARYARVFCGGVDWLASESTAG